MSDKLIDIDALLAQAGNRDNHDQYHSVSTPIYLTSNFRHRDLEDAETFDPHKRILIHACQRQPEVSFKRR